MNDKTTVYRNYFDPMEAHIVKSRIADAGFACFLADENLATLNPLYTQAIGGIRLIVFERDLQAIEELMSEEVDFSEQEFVQEDITPPELDETAKVICENCGSDHVGFGTATKKRFGFFTMILAFATLTYPISAKKCYHCYDCGHEFI